MTIYKINITLYFYVDATTFLVLLLCLIQFLIRAQKKFCKKIIFFVSLKRLRRKKLRIGSGLDVYCVFWEVNGCFVIGLFVLPSTQKGHNWPVIRYTFSIPLLHVVRSALIYFYYNYHHFLNIYFIKLKY